LQVAVKSYNLTSKEIEFKMVTGHQAKHNNGKKWFKHQKILPELWKTILE